MDVMSAGRPLLLDLYCKAGGATRGYQRAGFYVVGVDIEPQRHYVGDEFIQANAVDVLADRGFLAGFDVIAASPPCQDHSPLSALVGKHGTGWLLPATRDLLMAQPVPWVIENVASAEARADFMLCGTMFGLRTYRHRKFEIDPRLPYLFQVPEHRRHRIPAPTKRRAEAWARGEFVSATGDVGSYCGPEGLGIDWMTGAELSQAIPPAYTEYIGQQLLDALRAADAPALPAASRPGEDLRRLDAHRPPLGRARPVAAHRHQARPVQPRRRAALLRGSQAQHARYAAPGEKIRVG